MRIFNVIKRTVLTEKTYKQMEGKRKFVFEVAKNANKSEIKHAFQTLFEINVESINTKNVEGKSKTVGRYTGKKPNRKIAIITVKPGQNLDVLLQDENEKNNEIIKEQVDKVTEAKVLNDSDQKTNKAENTSSVKKVEEKPKKIEAKKTAIKKTKQEEPKEGDK